MEKEEESEMRKEDIGWKIWGTCVFEMQKNMSVVRKGKALRERHILGKLQGKRAGVVFDKARSL